jgi:hypothetical protein
VASVAEETDEQKARAGCETLRDLAIQLRGELSVEIPQLKVQGISPGSQPLVLWRNRQSAASHLKYAGDAQGEERVARERFSHDFPRTFVVTDRGPYFDPKQAVRPAADGWVSLDAGLLSRRPAAAGAGSG